MARLPIVAVNLAELKIEGNGRTAFQGRDRGGEHFPGQRPWSFAGAIREDFWPE
jgi:hypothetical protein